jgi:hypothetical protein
MLRPISAPDTKELSETKKQSSYFDKLTGDKGDIKFFKSAGKAAKTYLRVWVGEGRKATDASSGPQWFEVIAATPEGATALDTK